MFCSDGEHMVMDIASMCSPIIYARRRSLLQTHTHTFILNLAFLWRGTGIIISAALSLIK